MLTPVWSPTSGHGPRKRRGDNRASPASDDPLSVPSRAEPALSIRPARAERSAQSWAATAIVPRPNVLSPRGELSQSDP